MKPVLAAFLSGLMLAGCASEPSYDKSAAPGAVAALRQAMTICGREQTASRFTVCQVAAQRDFAVAIHLPNMDAFDVYAAQMIALAGDRDAGRVDRRQMRTRAASIRNDYWLACDCNLKVSRGYDHGSISTFFGTGDTPVANSGPSSSSQP